MLSFLLLLHTYSLSAQIILDNNAPYDDPTWLVDNVLLGGGITASNYSYQGDSSQIGWFDAVNTNLGLDSGIVLCTGDIYSLDPINGSTFPFMTNIVTDPDLLAVANSVPGMIGQTFTVSSINDVAILEFDFIPTSDSLRFRYVFGSQEYFGFENTSYNWIKSINITCSHNYSTINSKISIYCIKPTNLRRITLIRMIRSCNPSSQQNIIN